MAKSLEARLWGYRSQPSGRKKRRKVYNASHSLSRKSSYSNKQFRRANKKSLRAHKRGR